MVSDVLRPILAHVRSKYSNTQPWTCNLEPQADKPRPRVVPLSQPQISKLLKTTCPVQCGPRVLVHFLRRQDFLDRAVAKCLRILIIQTKKGKFAKNTTNSWYKKPVASSPTAEDSSASRCSLRHNGPLQVRRSGGCRRSG